jgi:hypothetical protein
LISVEEWAEIRRLHKAEGMGIKRIARTLGVGRNTVRRALRREGVPTGRDGLHWPRGDGLIWPHPRRVVVSGKVAHRRAPEGPEP